MKIKFIILLVIFGSVITAQTRNSAEISEVKFKVEKYQGSIGNSPITMLLTIYPDSNISGYYYYDKVGRLFILNKSRGNKNYFGAGHYKLEAEQIESFRMVQQPIVMEVFEFNRSLYLNNDTLKGEWTYKGKVLPVNLIRENLKFDWRLLRYRSTGYFKNSDFPEQTEDYLITYPSTSTSPYLNAYFLNTVFSFSKNMIDFINSTQSNYLLIEENLGDNTTDEGDGYWSNNVISELVYIADSILTYCHYGATYAHNLYTYNYYTSVDPVSGEVFTVKNIFKADLIDSVLTLLITKYKNVLRQNNNTLSRSSFIENTDIYIAKGGIYFRILAEDLFLSFDEMREHLNTTFRNKIGLH
jgi:hypothetical protein